MSSSREEQAALNIEPQVSIGAGSVGELTVLSLADLGNPCGGPNNPNGSIHAQGPDGPRLHLCIDTGNNRVGFKKVRFGVTTAYDEHGRADRASHAVAGSGGRTVRMVLDMSDIFQGGVLSYKIKWKLTNAQSGESRGSGRIRGENPSKQMIKAYAGDLPIAVLAFHRSKFLQFDSDGAPRVGERADQPVFGLFGLEEPSSAEIWNWKLNITKGKQQFGSASSAAQDYPQEMRDAGHDVPDFDLEQLALESYQRFHALRPYWIVENNAWHPAPGDAEFAEACWQTEQSVRAGTPPTGWE